MRPSILARLKSGPTAISVLIFTLLLPRADAASLAVVSAILLSLAPSARAQAPSDLRWGGDHEGGAPFVEADPNDPTRLVGFDVEVAELIARGLGRTPRFVFVAFSILIARQLVDGRHPPCACFGAWSHRPLSGAHLVRNAVLVAVAVVALWAP